MEIFDMKLIDIWHEIIDDNIKIVNGAISIKGHIRMQVRSING